MTPSKVREDLEIALEATPQLHTLRAGELLGSTLTHVLLGRRLDALRTRWHELRAETRPSHPLGALRHEAFLAASTELLSPGSDPAYGNLEPLIAPALELAGTDPYLQPCVLGLATVIALRSGGRDHAAGWRHERLRAPALPDPYALVQVLLASGPPFADSMLQAEAVHLACVGATELPATESSAIIIAVGQLAQERGQSLLQLLEGGLAALEREAFDTGAPTLAPDGGRAPRPITLSAPSWRLDRKAKRLELRSRLTGHGQPLHAALGWVLAPVVHRWPRLVTDIMERTVDTRAIAGARGHREVEAALGSGSSLDVRVELEAVTISDDDRPALARRLEVGVEWARARYPQIACAVQLELVPGNEGRAR